MEHVACDTQCDPGKHLTYNVDTKLVSCEDCPSNTYSTGSNLRFSSVDGNWNQLPHEASLQCYWVAGIIADCIVP